MALNINIELHNNNINFELMRKNFPKDSELNISENKHTITLKYSLNWKEMNEEINFIIEELVKLNTDKIKKMDLEKNEENFYCVCVESNGNKQIFKPVNKIFEIQDDNTLIVSNKSKIYTHTLQIYKKYSFHSILDIKIFFHNLNISFFTGMISPLSFFEWKGTHNEVYHFENKNGSIYKKYDPTTKYDTKDFKESLFNTINILESIKFKNKFIDNGLSICYFLKFLINNEDTSLLVIYN